MKKVLADAPAEYDFGGIFRYWVVGTFQFPVILFYWYRWLDSRFVGTAAKTLAKKLFLDQFLISPPILAAFYVSMSLMEGREDLLAECKDKLVTTFQTSCCFWMPAQAINFTFVPQQFRVIYIATCSLLWVNILCIIKRGAGKEEK